MFKIAKFLVVMIVAILVSQTAPGVAASNPQFDVTGVWTYSGNQLQLFQEKDQVNGVYVNAAWAHRMEGRYVSLTQVHIILITRTRSTGCEVTMIGDITVSAPNVFTLSATVPEPACGFKSGQNFHSQWTRVL